MHKIIRTLILSSIVFATIPLHAANIYFESKNQAPTLGDEFMVQVLLGAQGELVNAAEGKVVFPAQLMDVVEIQNGNSSINFWAQYPTVTEQGVISFSGITPGGYNGTKGVLFSIVFRAKKSGVGSIDIASAQVLRNDGKGTPAEITVAPLSLSISQSTGTPTELNIKDTVPPDGFVPQIAQTPDLFGGKNFLVFATQDKGSGTDHYEVREGWWGAFVGATSPYLLANQNLDQKIFVKAVDKNGNEITESVSPERWVSWYSNILKFGILILSVLLIVYIVKRFNEKNS